MNCKIDGCENKYLARGLCRKHYRRDYYLKLKSDPVRYKEQQSKNQARRRKPENWEREKARNRKRLKTDTWRAYYRNRSKVFRSKTVHGRVVSLNAHVHSRNQSALSVDYREVLAKFGDIDIWYCKECGTKENLSFDHIVGFAQDGEHTIDNLQILCISCNTRKGLIARWTARVSTI